MPKIEAPETGWTVGAERTVKVTGLSEGDECRLDYDNGEGESDYQVELADENGVAWFDVIVPEWDQIDFSIDPDSFEDDVSRSIEP